MSKLAELQKKYPKAKYEPSDNCPDCKGTGERQKTLPRYGEVELPCFCIMLSSLSNRLLKETMVKIKNETNE